MSDPHVIATVHAPNLRDVGGWPTRDGGVLRCRVLHRSSALTSPGATNDPVLRGMGLAAVVDLRTTAERGRHPDHAPAGVPVVPVDVLGGTRGGVADAVGALTAGRTSPDELLRTLDAPAAMEHTYRQFVTEPGARAGFATALRTLLDHDGAPVLIHCTAGKDRTGWAVAVAMSAAGATAESVMEEYLAVRPAVGALFAPMLEQVVAAGLDASRIAPLLDVDERYLGAALTQVEDDYGGLDGYLRAGLGLTGTEVGNLRRVLTAS